MGYISAARKLSRRRWEASKVKLFDTNSQVLTSLSHTDIWPTLPQTKPSPTTGSDSASLRIGLTTRRSLVVPQVLRMILSGYMKRLDSVRTYESNSSLESWIDEDRGLGRKTIWKSRFEDEDIWVGAHPSLRRSSSLYWNQGSLRCPFSVIPVLVVALRRLYRASTIWRVPSKHQGRNKIPDKTLDCRFFKWIDAGKDDEYIAQLEAECRGLKLTVAELQCDLETTKAKALRRKGQLHLTQQRLGNTVDECKKLVSHIRSVHLVVCRLEAYMTYGILCLGLVTAYVTYLVCRVK
ncbi:hypothetical protein LINPERHAP2_LOCUS615 [Linum perenne]